MKNKIKSTKNKLLKGINIKKFSLFLAAAFILLMLSKLSESSLESITFALEVYDLPKEVQLLTDSSHVVEARIKSTGFAFLPLVFQPDRTIKLSAQKDLKKLNGNRYLWVLGNTYENLNIHLSESFEVVTASPDSIIFKYDMLTSNLVEIKPNINVSYALGYDLFGGMNFSRDSVKIIGPESVIDTIQFVETEMLQLNEMKTDIDQSVILLNPDPSTIKLNETTVRVKGLVKRFTEGEMSVPIELVNIPSEVEINYFPKEITLNYYVDLEHFNEVDASDFKVICDFSEYERTGQFYLTPELEIKSEYVKSARVNTNKVDFIFL